MTGAAAPVPVVARGPAYPRMVKWMATVLVAGMLLQGAWALGSLQQAQWNAGAALLLVGALGIVVWCLSWIWRSHTEVNAEGVRQTWIWTKTVAWRDVAQARILAVPRLEWLIAPRLIVRVRGGGMLAFYTADPQVLRAFALFVTTGSPPCLPPEAAPPTPSAAP